MPAIFLILDNCSLLLLLKDLSGFVGTAETREMLVFLLAILFAKNLIATRNLDNSRLKGFYHLFKYVVFTLSGRGCDYI